MIRTHCLRWDDRMELRMKLVSISMQLMRRLRENSKIMQDLTHESVEFLLRELWGNSLPSDFYVNGFNYNVSMFKFDVMISSKYFEPIGECEKVPELILETATKALRELLKKVEES